MLKNINLSYAAQNLYDDIEIFDLYVANDCKRSFKHNNIHNCSGLFVNFQISNLTFLCDTICQKPLLG